MVLIHWLTLAAAIMVAGAGAPALKNDISPAALKKLTGNVFDATELVATPLKATGNGAFDAHHAWYRLTDNSGAHFGWLCMAAAKGRYEYFDYAAVYDTTRVLRHISIVAYRSDYGYGIQNRGWLKKLEGRQPDNHYEYGKNVDAISGSTYSASSMVSDLNDIRKNFTKE